MTTYLAVIGLLTVAAITPGPNNFIVLERAAHGGVAAAVGPIIGVVAGSLALLGLVWFGVDLIRRSVPQLDLLVAAGGALYLIWLGLVLALRSKPSADPPRGIPTGAGAVALFQLANPKAWVLVTTASAAVAASGTVIALAGLMAAISILCLTLWACLGAALTKFLRDERNRTWFDRGMGALLIVSAMGVLIDAV